MDDQGHSGKWILENSHTTVSLQAVLCGSVLEQKCGTEMQASALCFHYEALLKSL